MKYQYSVIFVHEEDGRYSALVPDLPGCVSMGDTLQEARANVAEAMRGHIECLLADGDPVPPASHSAATLEVELSA